MDRILILGGALLVFVVILLIAYRAGRARGHQAGYDVGDKLGRVEGWESGHTAGLAEGYVAGVDGETKKRQRVSSLPAPWPGFDIWIKKPGEELELGMPDRIMARIMDAPFAVVTPGGLRHGGAGDALVATFDPEEQRLGVRHWVKGGFLRSTYQKEQV